MVNPMRILGGLVLNWKFLEIISRFCDTLCTIDCTSFPTEKTEDSGSVRVIFPIKVGCCLTCHKVQGFTCGQGHVYERGVVNFGTSSVETWGSGLGFVACFKCTCVDNLAFDGTWQGQGCNVIQKGKQLTRWDTCILLYTNIQIFKHSHMCCVEWWGRKISPIFLSWKCTGMDRGQKIDGNTWLNCTPVPRW